MKQLHCTLKVILLIRTGHLNHGDLLLLAVNFVRGFDCILIQTSLSVTDVGYSGVSRINHFALLRTLYKLCA